MSTRSTTSRSGAPGVRRNLFHHHLSRRPTTSSTSTSASTLPASPEDTSADIVIRDKNGNYQVEIPLMPEERQQETMEKEKEDARLAEAVKHHSRDRNRQPTGKVANIQTLAPKDVMLNNFFFNGGVELMAAVQASLRSKAASLQEDNWMYEAEDAC
ncbi:MAG: hypothetical protein M1813_006690 [Trichoglossum hirsutum]|nr:MAG: hypothetical protein M1813_006690 [Trichoglossum hirsutum]